MLGFGNIVPERAIEVYRQFENVREYTPGTEHRIHFISEDGLSISTSLPFFLERESRK